MIAQLANPSAFNHTLRTSGEGPDGGHSDERSRTASLLVAVTMSATTSAQGLYARPNGGPVLTMLSVYAVGDSRRRPRYRTFVTKRNCRRHIRTWLVSACRLVVWAVPAEPAGMRYRTIICSRCSMGAAQRGSVIRSGRLRSVSLKNQQCSAIASYAILNTKLDFRESLR